MVAHVSIAQLVSRVLCRTHTRFHGLVSLPLYYSAGEIRKSLQYLFNMTDDTLRKFQIKKVNWLIGHQQVHWTCWTVPKTTKFEKRASYSAIQHCIFGKEWVQQPGGHSGSESLKILALSSCSIQNKFLETRLNSHEKAPNQRTQIEQIQKLAINRRLSVCRVNIRRQKQAKLKDFCLLGFFFNFHAIMGPCFYPCSLLHVQIILLLL